MENNLLSFITFTPLLGALILALFLRGDDAAAQRNAKWLALGATVFTFLFSIGLLTGFDAQNTDFQFVEERTWLLGLTYKMGVDGISVLFVMLTTFLMPLVIAACCRAGRAASASSTSRRLRPGQSPAISVAAPRRQSVPPLSSTCLTTCVM